MKLSPLGYFLGHLKNRKFLFIVSLIIIFLVGVVTTGKAWLIKPFAEAISSGSFNAATLTTFVLVVGGLFMLNAFLGWIYPILAKKIGSGIVKDIRRDLADKLARQSLGYFSEQSSGELSARVINDVSMFEAGTILPLQNLIKDSVQIICLVTFIMWLDMKIAIFSLVALFICGIIMKVVAKIVKQNMILAQKEVALISKHVTEIIGGIELVIGMGLEKLAIGRIKTATENLYNKQMKVIKVSSLSTLLVGIVTGLFICTVLYLTGTAYLNQQITFGVFGSFLAGIYLLQQPLIGMSQSFSSLAMGMASLSRIVEMLDTDETVKFHEENHVLLENHDLSFDKVAFAYGDSRIIKDLSFNMEFGNIIAIVGESGAGKSTIAKLLMRFYDVNTGSIYIGDTNIKNFSRQQLYSLMAYIPQEIFLFEDTIKNNITFGQSEITDEALEQVIKLAELEKLIQESPEGLMTRIGERGIKLSGGQKQRVAIARALLTDAKILILDEATSALDMELEKKVLQNIVSQRKDRLIIAITHRLSIAEVADDVIVMSDGVIVERGRAQHLVGQNGYYANLKVRSMEALLRA